MKLNTRILIVDDNRSIHEDFRKVLCPEVTEEQKELDVLENELFGDDDHDDKDKSVLQQVCYDVESAYQGEEALKCIIQAEQEGKPFTMCFIDVRMPPGWDGIETIQRIWEKYPYIEMVLCTAYSDYSWDEILSSLGNTDRLLFLRKPFDSIAVSQMAATLVKKWNVSMQAKKYVDGLEREIKERTQQLKNLLCDLEEKNRQLESSNKDLEKSVLHDPLTELPNRALFRDRLEHSIEAASRNNEMIAVLVMGLNSFMDINEAHGHEVSDKILQEIGKRLSISLRKSDTVARLGTDKYAIILASITKDNVPAIVKKVSSVLEEPVVCDNTSLSIGSNIGVSYYPLHGADSSTLLKNADTAMHQAKQAGTTYRIFTSGDEDVITDTMELTVELRKAIEQNALSLNYQPIIDLKNKTVFGLEALSRWHHPTLGSISPEKFIAIAEQNGLIQELTLWVLNEACKQCSKWRSAGAAITVSVNLSVRNFLDPNLPEKIKHAMDRWNVKPEWIKLEITESMTISSPEKALKIVHTFKEMGLELSIDDFGSGYSSLGYLKRLPVDELKIDRSFIMEMDDSADDRIIVQSTIELAHNLGLKVVAEGVENDNTLSLLTELGCDKAQGFRICKPKTAEEISTWLFESNWAIEKAS